MRKVFDDLGEFRACRAAERWCDERGIAVGVPQRGQPRGLMVGYYRIAKWSHLSGPDRRSLAGTMTGDMRHGPVVIEIKGDESDYPLLDAKSLEYFAGPQ
jgi:hypothetical protein